MASVRTVRAGLTALIFSVGLLGLGTPIQAQSAGGDVEILPWLAQPSDTPAPPPAAKKKSEKKPGTQAKKPAPASPVGSVAPETSKATAAKAPDAKPAEDTNPSPKASSKQPGDGKSPQAKPADAAAVPPANIPETKKAEPAKTAIAVKPATETKPVTPASQNEPVPEKTLAAGAEAMGPASAVAAEASPEPRAPDAPKSRLKWPASILNTTEPDLIRADQP